MTELDISYNQHLLNLVSAGLAALDDAQSKNRRLNNPVAETHFLGSWIVSATKSKEFDRCLAKDLTLWVQESRTKGPNARFKDTFERIKHAYSIIGQQSEKNLTQVELEAILDELTEDDWLIETESVITTKLKLSSSGEKSLVICADVYDKAFTDTDGVLEKPLSVYIRNGDDEFIKRMFEHGYLVFAAQSKSLVKRHNKYVVRPFNLGNRIAILPADLGLTG